MIFIPTSKLKVGMVLGESVDVQDKEGTYECLLNKGVALTPHYIEGIKKNHIEGIYVYDGTNDKIKFHKTIAEETKKEVTSKLENVFTKCHNLNAVLSQDDVVDIKESAKSLVSQICSKEKLSTGIVDLQTYDENTYYHCLSVAVLSIAMGEDLGFENQRLVDLATSALLHDIGKINVPVEIITKPARLTEEEFLNVKQHPQYGVQYVADGSGINREVYDGILMHHEKFDGTGYPSRIKGERIPLFAKIIAIADVYDALTATRPYRIPMSPSEAIEYIMANAGTAFDYEIIQSFLRRIEPYPDGSVVKLSDGRSAVVLEQSPHNNLRPTVRTIGPKPEILELATDFRLTRLVISNVDYGIFDARMDTRDKSLLRTD